LRLIITVCTYGTTPGKETDLDGGHPFLDGFFAAFAIHDAGTTPAPKERITVKLAGRFSEMRNLLARGDMVSANQSMKQSHGQRADTLELTSK
jgi:hypothetical protein